jgi:hypothetical protein
MTTELNLQASPRSIVRRVRRPSHVLAALLLASTACAPVASFLGFNRTTPESAIEIDNTLDRGVNVYVLASDRPIERFIGQVGAGVTRIIRVEGIAAGTTVRLRAVPVDGAGEYRRADFVTSPGATWRIP